MPRKIYILSQNSQRTEMLKKQLMISFAAVEIVVETIIFHNGIFEHNDMIIYDSATIGQIPTNYIMNSGGCWLNMSKGTDETTQMRSLIDGFAGVISVNSPVDQLPRVIRCMLNGEYWFSRHIIAFAIRQYQSQSISSEEMTEFAIANLELTIREKELTRLLVRGQSNQQIADSLCISIHTVKTHVSRILGKLNVQSRSELLCFLNHYIREDGNSELQPMH